MKKALLLALALIASGCGPPPPDGPYENYYDNGQLQEKGTYAAGERDGPAERFYENGQLQSKGTYVAGNRDGPYERFYESGQLRAKGTMNMGGRCGEWIDEGATVTYPPCPPPGLEGP